MYLLFYIVKLIIYTPKIIKISQSTNYFRE
nr:MAG TPA: hypothetical protein [Caudoviricetes sp.]